MLSLRSVITQATRGGRCVVSRRSFCSETKSAEEIRKEPMFGPMTPLIQISFGYLMGLLFIRPMAVESREKFKQGTYPSNCSELPKGPCLMCYQKGMHVPIAR